MHGAPCCFASEFLDFCQDFLEIQPEFLSDFPVFKFFEFFISFYNMLWYNVKKYLKSPQ